MSDEWMLCRHGLLLAERCVACEGGQMRDTTAALRQQLAERDATIAKMNEKLWDYSETVAGLLEHEAKLERVAEAAREFMECARPGSLDRLGNALASLASLSDPEPPRKKT